MTRYLVRRQRAQDAATRDVWIVATPRHNTALIRSAARLWSAVYLLECREVRMSRCFWPRLSLAWMPDPQVMLK